MDMKNFQYICTVDGLERLTNGVDLLVDGEHLRIEFMREDVLRLKMTRGGQWDTRERLAIDPAFCPKNCPVQLVEDGMTLTLSSAQINVHVCKAPFHLEARRTDGSLLFSGKRDDQGKSLFYGELNDDFVVNRTYLPGDAIYGLGEKTGRGNRRGRSFILWNTDVLNPNATGDFNKGAGDVNDPRSASFDPYYISIPFFYHRTTDGHVAGFFVDNAFQGDFEFMDGWDYRFRFHGGHYTEYIMAGPTMRQVVEAYTWITGRMARPPMWALGHHQSRWAQYTSESFKALGQTYRDKDIPCDALWFDINYMKDFQVFTWNTELVPDPGKLLKEVAENGFRTVTIIDPGISAQKGYHAFEDGMTRDMFCRTESGAVYNGSVWPGKTVFPDYVRSEVRAWWAEQIADHLKKGLNGIWNDMNEPSSNIPLTDMRFNKGTVLHERHHNEYAMLMGMATVDGTRKALPNQRPFVLSRAGSAGIQRCSANWTGDVCARWDHLRISIPMLMGLGLSGQPFAGADIPGFFENPDPELAVRWYQTGVFYPFCRNHSCNWGRERYPWSFGPAVEQIVRDAIRLRYQLLPYLYAAMVNTSETGEPVMRPLVFDFQYDATACDIDDQFLLGESLMVAPVCKSGQTSRLVYLPEGWWYDWRDGSLLEGCRFITASAPLDSIPVYVRAGSVIPLWPDPPQTTMDYHPGKIALRIFVPVSETTSTVRLVEDDGLSEDYRRGRYLDTTLELIRKEKSLTLRGYTKGEGYNQFKRRSFEVSFVGASLPPRSIETSPSFKESWNFKI